MFDDCCSPHDDGIAPARQPERGLEVAIRKGRPLRCLTPLDHCGPNESEQAPRGRWCHRGRQSGVTLSGRDPRLAGPDRHHRGGHVHLHAQCAAVARVHTYEPQRRSPRAQLAAQAIHGLDGVYGTGEQVPKGRAARGLSTDALDCQEGEGDHRRVCKEPHACGRTSLTAREELEQTHTRRPTSGSCRRTRRPSPTSACTASDSRRHSRSTTSIVAWPRPAAPDRVIIARQTPCPATGRLMNTASRHALLSAW